jgi:hypothetical protein
MIAQASLLARLVRLVDRLPPRPASTKRGRGRPPGYSERLFLKAWIVMLVRHIHTVAGLLTVWEQPPAEMQRVREVLCEDERGPSRRTRERRLDAWPRTLPGQIGCLGRHLLAWLQPWGAGGKAVALDSTVLRVRGGVWHKNDREAGVVSHTSIDTEAHGTKSGWHGWVYGWKGHVLPTGADGWLPLAAELTAANAADNEVAPALLRELPAEVRYLWGQHYHAPPVRALCECRDCRVIASQPGPYPHTDAGVGVRRLFHQLRSRARENFNEPFKGCFDV